MHACNEHGQSICALAAVSVPVLCTSVFSTAYKSGSSSFKLMLHTRAAFRRLQFRGLTVLVPCIVHSHLLLWVLPGVVFGTLNLVKTWMFWHFCLLVLVQGMESIGH